MSPPTCANSALRAESVLFCDSASDSDVASAARDSVLRDPGFVDCLSPHALRLGQSLCQCEPLHQRQGAHFSLRWVPVADVWDQQVCHDRHRRALRTHALRSDSTSRRTLRASTSLSTLRAALMVRARFPTPALRDNFTSSSVERLSLRCRTALATISESTVSGS
eukprot:6197125-Pleurochrysis_carterae.AAC.2